VAAAATLVIVGAVTFSKRKPIAVEAGNGSPKTEEEKVTA